MFHWVRRAIVVAAVVVVVGGLLLVVTARGDLNHTRNDVKTQWAALRPALDARYQLLKTANDTVRNDPVTAGLVTQTDAALRDWSASNAASVSSQVTDANALEALGRRLASTIDASSRLHGKPAVTNAMNAFARAPAPAQAAVFNHAVHSYESARGGALRRPVVSVFGYHSIPAIDLGSA